MPELANVTDLRLTLVQTALHWHNPEANRQLLQNKWQHLKGKTDLVVLPEMFTSGFTQHPEDFNDTSQLGHQYGDSQTFVWLKEQAQYLGAAITGSVACHFDTSVDTSAPAFVNRMVFVKPSGECLFYDKVHLFRMANEHQRYQAGSQRTVISYQGWRLLLTVCYDLRFPVFCRNRQDYDLMLCVANWPAARREHWRTLLKARAIENQSYVAGVNRVGIDGNKLAYAGDSMIVDAQGNILLDQEGEWLETRALSKKALIHYRESFPAWQDADDFTLAWKTKL